MCDADRLRCCVEEQMMPCVEDCYKQDGNTGYLKSKSITAGKKETTTIQE